MKPLDRSGDALLHTPKPKPTDGEAKDEVGATIFRCAEKAWCMPSSWSSSDTLSSEAASSRSRGMHGFW